MKILIWNLRGLGSKSKRCSIKRKLKEWGVDMVLIQETKREVISEKFVRSVWPSTIFEFVEVNAVERASDLLYIWNPDLFSLRSSCDNRNFIILESTISPLFSCSIVNIYGPNDVGARHRLWKTLLSVKNDYVNPWCIGGDLNEIRNLGEKARQYEGREGHEAF